MVGGKEKEGLCIPNLKFTKMRAQFHIAHSFQSPIHSGGPQTFIKNLLFARPHILVELIVWKMNI
jgi:hypothetical protein